MTVTKTTYAKYITLTGTLAEVMQVLSDTKVPCHKVVNVFYNGTNISAVYSIN